MERREFLHTSTAALEALISGSLLRNRFNQGKNQCMIKYRDVSF